LKKLVPMIFSHGLTGRALGNSVHYREFASHGMLVIAPDHMDGSSTITVNMNTG
jgi:hypothetical protein